MSVEPPLQPLTGESLTHATANCKDFAQLDVKAQGFWGLRHQCAHFDARVLTQMHQHTVTCLWTCALDDMKERRDRHISSVSVKLRKVHSLL